MLSAGNDGRVLTIASRMSTSRHLTGRVVRVGTCLIVTALILVPALLRAWQHFDPHDSIRLSTKLNWNGDAPRAKAGVAPDNSTNHGIAPPVAVRPSVARRSVHGPTLGDRSIPRTVLDSSPDSLRGPPTV